MILKFYRFWFEPPPTLIATLQLANRNASTRQSWHASTYQSLLTTRLLSPRTHANNSTPLFTNPRRRLRRFTFRLQHFAFRALTFHLLSSNISPSELRHRVCSNLPSREAAKVWKRMPESSFAYGHGQEVWLFFFFFSFFFLDLFIFPILDYEIYLIVLFELHEKQKKVKHYQRRVTVWALKPVKKFDSFNYCNLSTIANNRF